MKKIIKASASDPQLFIGNPERHLGSTVYIKVRNNFIDGRLTRISNSYPTKYEVRCSDGKTRVVNKIYVIDENVINSSVKASANSRIVADEYYPENYSDLGYDGLDEAVKQFDELRSILSTILGELDEFAEEYDEWGGSTSTLEMFPGPDDAKAFADTFYNLNKEAENILESVLAELR